MIRSKLRNILRYLSLMGINPLKLLNSFRGLPSFMREYVIFKKTMDKSFGFKLYPILDDKYQQGGVAKGHYFHQDLLVAQMIYKANPTRHIDIGSRVDGLISHLATFREVEIIDIREVQSTTPNIKFLQANMIDMKEELYESCESLSCLHALEHFGLGRYGDPIDVNGHLKGFENMYNILKTNGIFYFSVPIGNLRVEFNAHRVFSIEYLLFNMFKDKFEVLSFSYVDDAGDLHKKVELNERSIKDNFGCSYGCGIFELIKIR